jgi:hypothetical protein
MAGRKSLINVFTVFTLGLALAHGSAAAQPALDGTWEVTFSTRDTETRQAVVRITGAEGTWTTTPQGGKEKNDPCVGRAFPLSVTSAEAGRVVLDVAFSKVIAGCKDRTVTGQLVTPALLEGKLENGKPLRMVRP